MNYLVFQLYGAMASWGEIAVGESRHTANHPSKSALLGLIASALGIKREDEDAQLALAEGYHFAVWQQSSGDVMRDYHTTQSPDSVGKFQYRTRRDELVLGRERLGTILSSREYLTDSLCLVAVTPKGNKPPYTLEVIQQYLRHPTFHLYLGRKSCPLSAPLSPEVVTGNGSFLMAFEAYQQKRLVSSKSSKPQEQYCLSTKGLQRYYWEGDISSLSADIQPEQVQSLTRHDQVRSRRRWQFSPRLEYFYQREYQGD